MISSDRYFTNFYDLTMCMTNAVELISPEISGHHRQVAFLAGEIADELALPIEQKRTLVTAALLHDVGAIPLNEKLDYDREEDDSVNRHAVIGAELLSGFPRLKRAAAVIRYHHTLWRGGEGRFVGGREVPPLSHILHLADRIAVRARQDGYILTQIPAIRESIVGREGCVFAPEAVRAFLNICEKEALWLEFLSPSRFSDTPTELSLKSVRLTLDETVGLTRIFSGIIDFRSPFTAMHSAGVSAVARRLAELSGFSEDECKMMSIAGNLHDIGKLAIPREILEKQDRLEPSEYDVIRSHSYYTYRLLQPVDGFGEITQWAAYHHEKLNGKGYPFHLKAGQLSLGARMMAVADIFTAITEDRPYRAGMAKERAVTILNGMAESGGISPSVLALLLGRYDEIAELRKTAADSAVGRYDSLLQR